MLRFRLATALLALALPGCGIGESVTNPCVMEQDALQSAMNRRHGNRMRDG